MWKASVTNLVVERCILSFTAQRGYVCGVSEAAFHLLGAKSIWFAHHCVAEVDKKIRS